MSGVGSAFAPRTSYARRKLDVTLNLGSGGVNGASSNTVKLTGLRVIANVSKAIMPSTGTAMIRIFGMTLKEINQFTVAGRQWQNSGKNAVLLEAGDDQSGMAAVFNGLIREAYPDFNSMPNVSFVIIATAGIGIQLKPVSPTSFPGQVDAAAALQQIMDKSDGIGVENNGVSTQLYSPYFPGTVWAQALACTKAANCFAHLDDIKKVVAIWPKTSARNGDTVVVSPQTGMIGYPTFQQAGITLRTLFDPNIQQGGKIQVKSQLTAANGNWTIDYVDYNLASEMPDGPWEMTVVTHQPSEL